MKVAVIGGSGFIGRQLCRYLASRGHRVHATARAAGQALPDEEGIAWSRLDLSDAAAALPDFAGIDCVVYLAARAHVIRDSSVDPLAQYRAINCDAALRIAAAAASQGVARFIYLSSIGVNGVSSSRPFNEDDPAAPSEDYARSKLEAEQALAAQCAASAMQLVILRPPLVYGRGAPGNFGRLLALVASGRPLPLAALDNRRSLIAVENLVQVIEICIRHPAAANQLFLLADGEDLSTARLVELIAAALGKPARLLYVPVWLLRLGGMLLGKTAEIERLCGSLQVDAGKARRELGWIPALTPEQALRELGPE